MASGKKASGLSSLLGAASTKSAAKKKSTTPTVNASPEIVEQMKTWLVRKQQEITAEALRKSTEAELTPIFDDLRLKECESNRQLQPSIVVESKDIGAIQFERKGRCQKMRTEEVSDALHGIFGDADVSKYFSIVPEIKLNADFLHENADIADRIHKALMKALTGATVDGKPVELSDVLEADSVVVPNKQYYHDAVFDLNLRKKIEAANEDGLCIPYAPAYKTKWIKEGLQIEEETVKSSKRDKTEAA